MTKIEEIMAECESCGGSGVCHGFSEPSGGGVICTYCAGSGAKRLLFVRFKRRKIRKDIFEVYTSSDREMTVPYQNFLENKLAVRKA